MNLGVFAAPKPGTLVPWRAGLRIGILKFLVHHRQIQQERLSVPYLFVMGRHREARHDTSWGSS